MILLKSLFYSKIFNGNNFNLNAFKAKYLLGFRGTHNRLHLVKCACIGRKVSPPSQSGFKELFKHQRNIKERWIRTWTLLCFLKLLQASSIVCVQGQ